MTVRIMQGDCRTVLKTLPDASVHCVVTSPPYWGLRDYGVDGQIGLEQSVHTWVDEMVAVFREVRRVLRDDGTLWLNLGDSYCSAPPGTKRPGASESSTLHGVNSERYRGTLDASQGQKRDTSRVPGLKPKDLIGQPWRVAFALQADGWWLRQDIVWAKANPMPESVRDRCTKAHEYIFLLAKSERYYWHAAAMQEPAAGTNDHDISGGFVAGLVPGAPPQSGTRKSGNKERKPASARGVPVDTNGSTAGAVAGSVPWEGYTRNKRSVWTVATQPFAEAHFATFPPALIEPCILAGCPENVCTNCGGPLDEQSLKELRDVRRADHDGSAGPSEALLQQGVRVPLHSEEQSHNEGLHDHQPRLPCDLSADAPISDGGRLRAGAPLGDGAGAGPPAAEDRGCASQERDPAGQPAGEPGGDDESRARPPAKAGSAPDRVPTLRRAHRQLSPRCPRCGADLQTQGAVGPGTVLDCFFGAGTTGLVADRLQRDCIGIELNPAYIDIARRRIAGDAPLFAEVAHA